MAQPTGGMPLLLRDTQVNQVDCLGSVAYNLQLQAKELACSGE
jgi:hypothetical protein